MENHQYLFNLISGYAGDIIAGVLVAVIPLGLVLLYALVAIYGELKIASFIHLKLGPMRTGKWGLLQPIAEVFKLLQKEDVTPDAADKPLYIMAPFIIFLGTYLALAVLPLSSHFVPVGLNIGLFFIIAISSLSVIAIVMGGWASDNKYSLIGAVRSVAQIVSYEIPGAMCVLGVAAMAHSLDMNVISAQQDGGFWNWYIFGGPGGIEKIWVIPFTAVMFLLYFVTGLAENNRTPFDVPEGESEIVAGYHTEYSGMKFAFFYLAEYGNMFVVNAILVVLFLGGWSSPFGDFLNSPIWQVFWFISKSLFFVGVQMWLRWTLPRIRVDQLMHLCWKVMLPISMVCFLAMALAGMLF